MSGNPYQEIDTFVPQFDEIGVLPPIGRWDPLQIREQGPARYRRFVEMEIKHGRLAMAGFLGAITTCARRGQSCLYGCSSGVCSGWF